MAGCVGDVEAWQKKYPFVDFFLAPGQDMSIRDKLADLVEIDQFYRIEPPDAARLPRISEGITMHQGCNRNCTFCIVPSTRGRERSRTPDDILCEVRGLIERGTREVVLLSQIAERYGRDLRPRSSLADLLRVLNDEADGLQRIRFLTSYPADFHPNLIEAIATLPKVVEDINLPLQSGDDEVLQRMRRGYTYGFYRDLVGPDARADPEPEPRDGHHRRVPRRDRGPVPEHPEGARRDQVRRRPHRGLLDPDRHPGRRVRGSASARREEAARPRGRSAPEGDRDAPGTRRCSGRTSRC